MHMRVLSVAVALLAVLTLACGEDATTPVAPSPTTPTTTPTPPPPVTVTSLSVSAPSWFADAKELEVGQTVQLRADVTLSDGSTRQALNPAWTSSNTVVATIDGVGVLTGRQAGGFDVRVRAEDVSTALTGLRVIPPPQPDFIIRNVHRYEALGDAAHWIEFDVHAQTAISRITLGIRVYAGDTLFVECDQRISSLSAGQLHEETVIPDICGLNQQWTHFDIMAPDGLRCEGCRRYLFSDVPERR